MSLKKIGIGAALAGSAVAIVIGGSTLASAGTPATGAVSSTSGSSFGAGAPGGSSDTAVSGAELTKVTAAMTAKDPTVTVTAVRQDADGSYDVLGTKAGARVMYDVSADLATFTAHTGGPGGGGHGGPGGSSDTAVSGAELTKVTAAMTAKDPTVTVTAVRQDADGSYDVLGTKAGARVMYDVSADLATFTAHTGGPGGGGRGHGGPEGGTTGTPPGSSGTATPSA